MTTLQVRRATEGALDRYNNPTVTWSDPEPWVIRGMAPGASVEPTQPNRDAALVEWTVYADPSAATPGVRDRVLVGTDEYAVVATPQDWTRGPWPAPFAGVVVELKRWEG